MNHSPKCPECGAPMAIRYSKKNDRHFFGCTRFPLCHRTERIPTEWLKGIASESEMKRSREEDLEAYYEYLVYVENAGDR